MSKQRKVAIPIVQVLLIFYIASLLTNKFLIMRKVFLSAIGLMFLMSSCGAVGVVSSPSSYESAGKEVSATKKNVNVFGLSPMDAQKESGMMLKELESQCSNGVTNIRTTVSATSFILFFEKIEMAANCK